MSDCFKVDSTAPGYIKISGRSIPVSSSTCKTGDFSKFLMSDAINQVNLGGYAYSAVWLSSTEIVAFWSPTSGQITVSKIVLTGTTWSITKTTTLTTILYSGMDFSVTKNSNFIIVTAFTMNDNVGKLYIFVLNKDSLNTVGSYTSNSFSNHYYQNFVTCSMYSDSILLVSYPVYFTNYLDSFTISSSGSVTLKSHISALSDAMYGCGVGRARSGLAVVLGTNGSGSSSPLKGSFFSVDSQGVVSSSPVYSNVVLMRTDGSGYGKKAVKNISDTVFYTFSDGGYTQQNQNSLEVVRVDCSNTPTILDDFFIQGFSANSQVFGFVEEDFFFSLASRYGTFLFAIGNDSISLVQKESGNLLFSTGQFLNQNLYYRSVTAVKAYSDVSGIASIDTVPSIIIP